MAVKVVHVHLHLAEVLMRELADLEIDTYISSEQPVIKREMNHNQFYQLCCILAGGLPLQPPAEAE